MRQWTSDHRTFAGSSSREKNLFLSTLVFSCRKLLFFFALLFLCFVLFRSFFLFLFCWICSTMHMMMTPAEEGARESGAEERMMIHVYACHGKLASFTITCHSCRYAVRAEPRTSDRFKLLHSDSLGSFVSNRRGSCWWIGCGDHHHRLIYLFRILFLFFLFFFPFSPFFFLVPWLGETGGNCDVQMSSWSFAPHVLFASIDVGAARHRSLETRKMPSRKALNGENSSPPELYDRPSGDMYLSLSLSL